MSWRAAEHIAVSERRAAQMLDLPVSRFREYVREGILPRPKPLGKDERWDVEELRRIVRGEPMDDLDAVKW